MCQTAQHHVSRALGRTLTMIRESRRVMPARRRRRGYLRECLGWVEVNGHDCMERSRAGAWQAWRACDQCPCVCSPGHACQACRRLRAKREGIHGSIAGAQRARRHRADLQRRVGHNVSASGSSEGAGKQRRRCKMSIRDIANAGRGRRLAKRLAWPGGSGGGSLFSSPGPVATITPREGLFPGLLSHNVSTRVRAGGKGVHATRGARLDRGRGRPLPLHPAGTERPAAKASVSIDIRTKTGASAGGQWPVKTRVQRG